MRTTYITSPLACDLGALSASQRRAHQALTVKLFHKAQAVDNLPNGLGFRFANERSVLRQVADFIANEQLCCPFLDFAVKLEPGKERLQLSLTGSGNVNRFLRLEFADVLKGKLA